MKNNLTSIPLSPIIVAMCALGLLVTLGAMSRCMAQSFASPVNYSVGTNPYAVALGDFNGDGRSDLAVANNSSKNVSVLLGNGDGTFGAKMDYDVSASPVAIVLADFNGDSKFDIATANYSGASTVSVLFGNGNGTFQPGIDYALSSSAVPNSIAAGDFNGDGKPDLVTANEDAGGASVLLNKGDGTFDNAVNYGVGQFANSVAVADFNKDGKLDLAVSSYGGNNGIVSILLGKGDGTFTPAVNYAAGPSPFGIATADFNGDGQPDLATANIQVDSISVLLGNGDGTFSSAVNYPAGQYSFSIATGDFNSDGRSDLVTANVGYVNVLAGNGDGSFSAPVAYNVGALSVTVGELNGDGKPDLVTAGGSLDLVTVLLNQTGPFSIGGTIKDANNAAMSGVSVFLSGGAPITAITTSDGSYVFRDLASGGSYTVTPIRGNYSFAPPNQVLDNLSVDAIADFTGTLLNLDYFVTGTVKDRSGNPMGGVTMTLTGTKSMVVSTASDGSYSFQQLPGLGNYTITPSFSKFMFRPPSASLDSLSNNRRVDFTGTPATYTISGVVRDPNNSSIMITGVPVLLNGTRTDTTVTASYDGSYSFSGLPVGGNYTVSVFDSANGRLFTNLLLSPPLSQSFTNLSADMTANFSGRGLNFNTGDSNPLGVAAGDFNEDGKSDLVVATTIGSSIHVLLGNGDGTFKPQVAYAAGANPGAVVVGDFNGDGKPDIASADYYGADVSIFIGNGDGTFKNRASYPVGGLPSKLTLGDFDGDGNADLAVLCTENKLNILLGNADGTFKSALITTVPLAVSSVSVGDLNADNKPDVLILGDPDSVLVLLGKGDGTFADAVSYAAGFYGVKACVADFNADGKLDVAVANNRALTILLGKGDGTLQTGITHPLNTNTADIISGDFDADNRRDLVVANYYGGISFLAGNADGTFKPAVLYSSYSYSGSLVSGDFNNDGKSDLAITSQGNGQVSILLNTSLSHLPALQFSASGYNVSEGSDAALITVTRSGDTSGAGTVGYSTSDGTAKQTRDYTTASGTLSFVPGETSKTFSVIITDNNYIDGDRSVLLTLSNPTGAVSATPTTTVLTIADNDTAQPITNPIDDPRFFVRQHYYDFLNRLPDDDGLNYWTSQITSCNPSNALCIRGRRIAVSDAFFFEPEFQQTGAYVFRLYRAAYGNDQPFPNVDGANPSESRKLPSYAAFVQDRARVIGGTDLARSQLALADAFVQRPEFLAKYPASQTDSEFVDALLATVQSASSANLTSQRDAWVNLFNQQGKGAVLYRLADDNPQTNPIDNRAFVDAEYNRAFVFTEYAGYLRRDGDVGGILFWLGQVNRFPLRDINIQHAMVCSFITSLEYQQRFSPITTHTNQECPQ